MRVLTVALAISAALHGGAIAWVQLRPSKDTEPLPAVTTPTVEIVPAPAAEPPPMVVALLDDHTVVTAPPGKARDRQPKASALAVSAGQQRTATETATTVLAPPSSVPAPETPPVRNPLMTMRKPRLDRVPSGDFTDRFLRNSKPLAPKDIRTEQLQDDLASTEALLKNSRWVANATPDQVNGARLAVLSLRDELNNRELKPDGAGTTSEHEAFRIKVAADGTAKIHDKANVQRKTLLSGTFDATDAMMRNKGIDPYASYKLKVLDETRDERVAIGKRYRTQQLARSKQLVQANLERLWSTSLDLAARKQGLFELWDDCAEAGPPEMERSGRTPASEDELVAGGTSARAHVLGFIRSRLPAGSEDAFTDAEVQRLNKQRKSHSAFAPY
jgi:hypothetical protein